MKLILLVPEVGYNCPVGCLGWKVHLNIFQGSPGAPIIDLPMCHFCVLGFVHKYYWGDLPVSVCEAAVDCVARCLAAFAWSSIFVPLVGSALVCFLVWPFWLFFQRFLVTEQLLFVCNKWGKWISSFYIWKTWDKRNQSRKQFMPYLLLYCNNSRLVEFQRDRSTTNDESVLIPKIREMIFHD